MGCNFGSNQVVTGELVPGLCILRKEEPGVFILRKEEALQFLILG